MIVDFAVGVMFTRHVLFGACLCVSVLSLKTLLIAQFIFFANQQHEASRPSLPDGRVKRAGEDGKQGDIECRVALLLREKRDERDQAQGLQR